MMNSLFIVYICWFISFLSCKTVLLSQFVENSSFTSASLLGEIRGTVWCQIVNLLEEGKFWLDIKLIIVDKNNTMDSILGSTIMRDVVSKEDKIFFVIQYKPSSLNIAKIKYALIIDIYHGKRLICRTKEPYLLFTKNKAAEENVNIILGNIA